MKNKDLLIHKLRGTVKRYSLVVSLLLAGLMSSGGAWALDLPAGTYYFDNTDTQWSAVALAVGNGTTKSSYPLTQVIGTNIWKVTISGWNGADGYYFYEGSENQSGTSGSYADWYNASGITKRIWFQTDITNSGKCFYTTGQGEAAVNGAWTGVPTFIGNSFMRIGGESGTWYKGSDTSTGFTAFQGANLGAFEGDIVLMGELASYSAAGVSEVHTTMYYRIDSGSFTAVSMPKVGTTGTGGVNAKHQGEVTIPKPAAGSHTLEVYYQFDTQYDDRLGSNYIASFTTIGFSGDATKAFGDVFYGTTSESNYHIGFGGCTPSAITASISGTDAAAFTLPGAQPYEVTLTDGAADLEISFSPTKVGAHTATLTFSTMCGETTYTKTVSLSATGKNHSITPLIADTADVTEGVVTLSGYLKYAGCKTDIIDYGFYYCEGADCTPSSSSSSIRSSEHTPISSGSSWSAQPEGLKDKTWYSYKSYAKSTADGVPVLSEETGHFYVTCDYPMGDTIYYTINAALSEDIPCTLEFSTFAAALTHLKSMSEYLASTSGNITNKLLKHIVFEVEAGEYGTAGSQLDLSNINKITHYSGTIECPTHHFIVRRKGTARPTLNGLNLYESRYVTIDGFNIVRSTTTSNMSGATISMGRNNADNNAVPGNMKNANLAIINNTITATGFCCVHVQGADTIYYENNELYADITATGDPTNDRNWGASMKFMNCKNILILRNSFRGSHATNLFLQGSRNVLIMNNVFWNDNKYTQNVAFIRPVYFGGDGENNALQNIGIYYNTFFLKDDGGSTPYKVNFIEFGGAGQTGNAKYYHSNLIEFQYNNCYSYSTNVSGRTADPFLGKIISTDICPTFKNNNFWSKYDVAQSLSASAFAFGCSDQFINVENAVCWTASSDPASLVVKTNALNLGVSIGTDISGMGIADKLYNDRIYGSNLADAVRPKTGSGSEEEEEAEEPNEYGILSSAPTIRMSMSSMVETISHDVDMTSYTLTPESDVDFTLSGTNAANFSLNKASTTTDEDGNSEDTVTVTFDPDGTPGTYNAVLNIASSTEGDVDDIAIPLVGIYANGPIEGGWTLGAYQQIGGNEVDVIVWNGTSDSPNDWDNRGNWVKMDGTKVTCVDKLSEKLKVIIPAPDSKVYPMPAGDTIKTYPNMPTNFNAENRSVKQHAEQVDAGVGIIETTKFFADSIYLEYGASLRGVEKLVRTVGEQKDTLYNVATTNFTAQRSAFKDSREWILVGTVIKPFTGNGYETRNIKSGDFYIANQTPHVYMQHIKCTDGVNVSWGTPFSSLQVEVPTTTAFAIEIPDQYGQYKLSSSLFYKYYYPDESMLNDGTQPKSFKFEGRFANDASLPTYSIVSGVNFLNNSYPANLDAYTLHTSESYPGTVLMYDYELKSFRAPQSGEVIKPQNGFIFNATSTTSMTLGADLFVDGNTRYKRALDEKPNIYIRAINAGRSLGSQIALVYDEFKEQTIDPNVDARKPFNKESPLSPELYIMAQDAAFASLNITNMETVIPLGLRNASKKVMDVKFVLRAQEGFGSAVLVDRQEGKEYDLLTGEAYTITNIAAGTIEGRFFLNLSGIEEPDPIDPENPPTDVEDTELVGESISIFAQNGSVIISSTEGVALQTVYVSDMAGKTDTYKLSGSHYQKLDLPVAKGVYLISVVGDTMTKEQKVIIK